MHSSWSLDAYSLGGNRNDPSMAYRFGRGEEGPTADGRTLQLRVPLDFMAVTDHDIWLGTVNLCLDESDAAYDTPTCEQVRANAWFGYGDFEARGRVPADICGQNEPAMSAANKCYERARHQWHAVLQNAEAFNDPGRFTTFRRTSGRPIRPLRPPAPQRHLPRRARCRSGADRPSRWRTVPSGSGHGSRRPAPATAKCWPFRTTPT